LSGTIVHHVGILADALGDCETLGVVSAALGASSRIRLLGARCVPEFDCDCAVYGGGVEGEALIEVIRPRSGALRRYLDAALAEGRPNALHHFAIAVDDVDEAGRRAISAGARLISPAAAVGVLDWRVNFIHPLSTGVLVELVEDPRRRSR